MPHDTLGVPAFVVKVNGQALKDTVAWQISRIIVDDHVDLPSMFTLELDAYEENQAAWLDDEKLFAISDEVVIQFKAADTALQTVITGEVTYVEIECSAASLPHLIVRGYDRRHRLQRGHKVRTFVKKKDSAVAELIAAEAGLSSKVVDSGIEHEYLVQANQTDFAFLQERARRIHYELVVHDRILHFRPVAFDGASAFTLSMESELSEFRAQLSAAGQVNQTTVRGWSVINKQAVVATSKDCILMGGNSSGAALSKTFGEVEAVITGKPVINQQEARQLAGASFAASALSLVRGEGRCQGRADLKAGKVAEIKGIGKRFSGPYYITVVNHRYDADGYSTNFTAWRNAL